MKQSLTLLGLLLVWVACRDANSPVDVQSDGGGSDASAEPVGDGGLMLPDDSVEARCGNACAQLARLGCPEAQPNPGGDSCVTICIKVEVSKKMTMKPDCIAKAQSVKELSTCGTVRCVTLKPSGAE